MRTRPATSAKSSLPTRGAAPTKRAKSLFSLGAIRETVESLAVALILAFLFRTFNAEAFVIPTGSMAPTLMGQHKDVNCPICGFNYRAGASGEVEELAQQRGQGVVRDVIDITCPMCRYTLSVDPKTKQGREYPTFGGDRILVGKTIYELSDPQRWDVIVFKYPAEAQTNYIKRLVGLPGETVRLWHGDLYVKPEGQSQFRLPRREPAKLRAMAQLVYDNNYIADSMTKNGWPVRWQPWPAEASDGAAKGRWATADGSRSYAIDGSSDQPQWLRYRHFVPSLDEWEKLKDGPLPPGYQPRPSLITDFYAYDTSVSRGQISKLPMVAGMHWVGDLLLECQLETTMAKGSITLELVEGGRRFQCQFDLATGQARLGIDGLADFAPQAQTSVRGVGRHRVMFANVDDELVLWVDGSSVGFDSPTMYEPLGNDLPRTSADEPGDLAPAGVAASGAGVRVSQLRLYRDIYYIAPGENQMADYGLQHGRVGLMNYDQLMSFWSTPALWAPPGQISPFETRREVVFPLAADQFFVLGDNSPMSLDARLWRGQQYVERELLVGKAVVIFWPHSFNRIPGTSIPFPFFPNFARMGFIR